MEDFSPGTVSSCLGMQMGIMFFFGGGGVHPRSGCAVPQGAILLMANADAVQGGGQGLLRPRAMEVARSDFEQ